MPSFQALLENVRSLVQTRIDQMIQNGPIRISGEAFENIVEEALRTSGLSEDEYVRNRQRFPDFVITDTETGEQFGLEVKKTESNRWEVPGGSIFESLRNEIEETYVIMGKLGNHHEARVRKYKECLADLSVTHSPRFQLNLDLEDGEDYLTRNNATDLLDMPEGEELNRRIRDLLRTNNSTWYSEGVITAYSDLPDDEKEKYFSTGIALFPEIVAGNYNRFTPWLVYNCLIWCGNVRDHFSASGTVLDDGLYISAVMNRIFNNAMGIKEAIISMSSADTLEKWGFELNEPRDKILKWMALINDYMRFSSALIANNRKVEGNAELNDEQIKDLVKDHFSTKLERLMLGAE